MLEIAFLVWFCKKLASMAREKNRNGIWGGLGALFWIGGEILGFMTGGTRAVTDMGAYGYAILGAIVGAVLAYVIVKALPIVPLDTGLPHMRVV